jgi:hypothetical protein
MERSILTQRTESEILFEELCYNLKIPCAAIAVGNERTPDYAITVASITVVVEVKQLDPNEVDRKHECDLLAGKLAVYSIDPGKRIRQLITRGKTQLRALAKDRHPAVLVMYNNVPFAHSYTDPMCILMAMYGYITVPVQVPGNPAQSPHFLDPRFGPKRSLTEEHNTSISALGVLYRDQKQQPGINFYHNVFAGIPLNPEFIRAESVRHYRAPTASSGEFQFWVEV